MGKKNSSMDRKQAQIQMDFRPGLTVRFQSWQDCIAHAVYSSRIGLNGVAAHCDLAPSQLSRMLNKNPDDLRHLPADLVPEIIKATGNKDPIYWLIEAFLEDKEAAKERTMAELVELVPKLQRLLEGLE